MKPSPLSIERATIRAWPATETEERFGWFFLASGGVTGRVNACWPLTWTHETPLDAAIDAVEAWYRARKMAPRFKITTNAFAPPHLCEALAARGYGAKQDTLVMTRALEACEAVPRVRLHTRIPQAFIDVIRETSADDAEFDERLSIARNAPQPAIFATIAVNDETKAIGMSACADDLAGVFLMRTALNARRQGFAADIVQTLLHWAHANGARNAFLQVEAANTGAIALYERFGFSEAARYAFWRPN